MDVATLNQILGTGTLALQVIVVGLVVALLLRTRVPMFREVIAQVASIAIPVSFAASLAGSVLTLYYSDILGFEPCPLCWWQRVFLYPQVVLFGLYLAKRNVGIYASSIALSVLGLAVALYHHALQMLPSGTLPCPATGVSCAQVTFLQFGYITYPLMAATLFAFLIVLMIARRVSRF